MSWFITCGKYILKKAFYIFPIVKVLFIGFTSNINKRQKGDNM